MNIKENVQDGHKERIKAVKDWRRTTYVNMAEETGISIAIFRQISSGYLNISVKTATILSKTYPGLNMQWLLTGEGTMLNDSAISSSEGYAGWSADQLITLIKKQEATISALNEVISAQKDNITSLNEHITILKEQAGQEILRRMMTKNIISDPVEQ